MMEDWSHLTLPAVSGFALEGPEMACKATVLEQASPEKKTDRTIKKTIEFHGFYDLSIVGYHNDGIKYLERGWVKHGKRRRHREVLKRRRHNVTLHGGHIWIVNITISSNRS